MNESDPSAGEARDSSASLPPPGAPFSAYLDSCISKLDESSVEEPLRAVIVDADRLFCEILGRVGRDDLGIEIVGRAENLDESCETSARLRPDVVLIDIGSTYFDGFLVARRLREARPSVRLIALTSARGGYTLYRIEREGFDGYVDKTKGTLASLREAVLAANQGKKYFDPSFVKERTARLKDPNAFDKVLSDREFEVLHWVGQALDDYEIARKMGIRPRTVETFRGRILKKLGVRGTPKLVGLAIRLGFGVWPSIDPAAGSVEEALE